MCPEWSVTLVSGRAVDEYPVRPSDPSIARELISTMRPKFFDFIASTTP